jgi:hypothetical protein
LEPLIGKHLLEEKAFFKNYQLLRNISLLAKNVADNLVIFLPRGNEPLNAQLRVLAGVERNVRTRIKVIYLEDCLTYLQKDKTIPEKLRVHAFNLAEKYIPPATAFE